MVGPSLLFKSECKVCYILILFSNNSKKRLDYFYNFIFRVGLVVNLESVLSLKSVFEKNK